MNTKTITSYPCQINPALKAECLEMGAYDRQTEQRFHACGAGFEQVVEVVEVEFVPAKRVSEKEKATLKAEARALKAQGVEHEEAFAEVTKANKINAFTVPQYKADRLGTGDRELILYTPNRQGKNVSQFNVTDWKRVNAWKSFTLPALPATV